MEGQTLNPKVYVAVTASFNEDGVMIPTSLTWEDGTVYEIDRVLDIRQHRLICYNAGADTHRQPVHL